MSHEYRFLSIRHFFAVFFVKKMSKSQNFHTAEVHPVGLYVYNMWFKFHENRQLVLKKSCGAPVKMMF